MDDSDHIRFMGDVRENLGALRAGQEAQLKYLENVDAALKGERAVLQAHLQDPEPHGVKTARMTTSAIVTFACLVGSVLAVGVKALGYVMAHPKAAAVAAEAIR